LRPETLAAELLSRPAGVQARPETLIALKLEMWRRVAWLARATALIDA
jgi:hypothetical protein